MSNSITLRLIVSSAIVVFAFLSLAGFSLNQAFHDSSEKAVKQQLQTHVYSLLAATVDDANGLLTLPEILRTPDFNRPNSGLYAFVKSHKKLFFWKSASLLGQDIKMTSLTLKTGETYYQSNERFLTIHQAISWDDFSGQAIDYQISILMDKEALTGQRKAFNRTLWGWLISGGLILLITQLALIQWGLRPLRRIADTVLQIQKGTASSIEGSSPTELRALTDNLNALIQHVKLKQERMRNSLADLAHSLKTPLTILRGSLDQQTSSTLKELIIEQTARIDEMVSYQRQKASVSGQMVLLEAIRVHPIAERIGNSLLKAYRDRNIHFEIQLDKDFTCQVEEGDIYELLGNVLENAFKHAHSHVLITHSETSTLCIEDNGKGIPYGQADQVLQRGFRADMRQPGQGIGLAVVNEIIQQYQGQLSIERSSLGGACIKINFSNHH